jgi:hypothetical protein
LFTRRKNQKGKRGNEKGEIMKGIIIIIIIIILGSRPPWNSTF